ncbi:MAG: tryptophan--tRNA ligase [Gammaproteobacteria bacterium]|nr:tryptophan--tRNA ligase [Gammaproteobacteria bacterium]MBU1558971.1 tryptophan--tRNA ligase [Gammaproteobacteria bacterium]MBU1628609.1 tryptophan--tRNA ligase [Gammaproteobacteria bacterium]MBU1926794.1 tryptophan--tRNA ligase [Gammaproteobacteria bacterium]MBU2546358.1 tryptophan--tRNA ligase [Gammaproteobacteria bacterium]
MSHRPHLRIVSGMRPTGALHLGHLHGVLKNWVHLQNSYDCFFFVADLHALTTEYADPSVIRNAQREMVIDWLAAGINPDLAHVFVQSHVPEVCELGFLLSMLTPLSWLERVPTYKDQQQKLKNKDLTTYGFLGYPLFMAADILLYKAAFVPVGEDQIPHVELVREIARRFNHFYGRDKHYADQMQKALNRLNQEHRKTYQALVKSFQEKGDREVIQRVDSVLNQDGLSKVDKEFLSGYVEGKGRLILTEPEVMLTKTPIFPGLDGQKMSKSYHNAIALRDDAKTVEQKIYKMPTDPARVRRTDPGDPEKCPVWKYHQIYSDAERQEWVQKGCRSAGIGCLECKKPLADCINQELEPIREQAFVFMEQPSRVDEVLHEGQKKAKRVASETLAEVKEVMGL